MIAHVGRVFSMRRNEVAPATLLFFYLFLIMGAYMMGKSVGDSMFLDVYPRHLPYAMIGTALLIGGFVSSYIRLSHRLRLQPLVIGTLLFFAFSFSLFWWLTRFQFKWVYMLIYIWVYTVAAMGPTMGWTLANYVLTTREARRLFGFIQAGAIIGVPFVGFITADVMRHGHAKPQTLLLVVALLLGVCTLLVKLLFKSARQRLAGISPGSASNEVSPKNLRQSLKLIQNSRYLGMLTLLIGIGCVATSILDYQFKLIAKAWYGSNTIGLTAYFARFYGYMGLATFVFNFALAGPLLRAFGIRVTLFVLPVALMAPSLGVLLVPTLVAGTILRGTHSLLRYSLDKSSTELLYLPVAPEIKNQVKSCIDTLVWRMGDGVAGLLLLLFVTMLKFSPGRVSLVNFGLLLGWVAIAYGVRGEYLNVLRQAIERRTLDPQRTTAGVLGVLDSTTTEVLARALERGGEQQVLYGLSLFEMGREPGWHPVLRGLLEYPSPAVRQRVLRLLSDAGDRGILPQVEKMLGDESPEVRSEAVHYLVVHADRDPLSLLNLESDFPDYSVQASVAAYLARTGTPENTQAAQIILRDMISRTDGDGARSRAEAARVLGVIPASPQLHSELLKLLQNEDPEVQEQAILSAGKIRSRDFLPFIIENLGRPRLVGAAKTALSQYGERAVGTLQDYLNDVSVPLPVRKKIPGVLAQVGTPDSAGVLAGSLIQSDPGLRFDVLKALNKLRRRDPSLLPASVDVADMLNAELMGYYRSLQILAATDPHAGASVGGATPPGNEESLLTRALRERMEHEFERIFRLLALLYPPRDVYNAYVGLTGSRPQLRANSVELLEHLLRPEHHRMLVYALDPEISILERLRFAERLCHTSVASKAEALRILLHSEDCWLCACALHAIGEQRLSELNDEMRRIPRRENPLLEETWSWAVSRLAGEAAS